MGEIMELVAEWKRATRQGPEKYKVEQIFIDKMTENCGSVEMAFLLKAEFERLGRPCGHPYITNYCQAHQSAVAHLPPCEQKTVEIGLKFQE
jgi:hypothetical protein